MVVVFKFPGWLTRELALVAGIFGYGLMVTSYVVPMFSAALRSKGGPLDVHEILAFALVSLVWCWGIYWVVPALAFSVSAGDWKKSNWARMRKTLRTRLDQSQSRS
jgi:type II secretory pathway component PulF